MPTCVSNLPLNDFTRLSYTQRTSNMIPRSTMMNVGRFRSKDMCSTSCINNSVSTWFKNSVNNQYLVSIPYGQRLGNLMRGSQKRGTKTIITPICINKQYGRVCGKGGFTLINTF